MTTQSQRPWYFNLKANGDSAIVRILHKDTATIESVISHRVIVDGKYRRVRCLEENCPLCKSGNVADVRIYVHVWDYTDNKEKVWERTDKIIPQLNELHNSWGDLSTAVVKITRKGDSFPKYDVQTVNPTQYAPVDTALIDKPIAKFYSMNRSAEDISTYLSTGVFPERKPYLPKEEYKKLKASEKSSFQQSADATTLPSSQSSISEESDILDDDPFADSNLIPNKKF